MKQLWTAIGLIVGGLVLLSQVGCSTIAPNEAAQLNTRRDTMVLAASRLDKAAWRVIKPGFAKSYQVNNHLAILVLSPDKRQQLAPCRWQCIKCWGEDCIIYLVGGELPDGRMYISELGLGHELIHWLDWNNGWESNPDKAWNQFSKK